LTDKQTRKSRPRQEPKKQEPPIVNGRVPPHDLDAEAAVLSALLLSRDAFDRVAEILKPDHFYSDANGRIYEAALALAASSTPIDIVSVASFLRDRDRLGQIGGPAYLAQLADATPAIAHVAAHAQTVYDKWRVRALIATCQRIAAEGYGDVGAVDDFIDRAEQDIFALAAAKRSKAGAHVSVVLADVFKQITAMAERGQRTSGYSTGYGKFDEKTAGVHAGDLMVMAARPGMGKAQPLDAKVLTPTGWRLMGDLCVGDMVIGADGLPHSVTGVFEQGERDIFRVVMDDGGSTRCCDEHLWLTRTRSDRRRAKAGAVRSLHDIRDTITRADSGGRNHSIQFMAPAVLQRMPGLMPIDPWLLGVYLGDGEYTDANVCIHKPERDLLERVASLLPPGDTTTPMQDDGAVVGVRIRKENHGQGRSATAMALTAMGLHSLESHEKFIPAAYLLGDLSDRRRLLRGLCDTDGYVTDPNGKSIEFTTTSERLRDDVAFLVGSIGGCVTWAAKQGAYVKNGKRHETRTAYRMVFSFPRGDFRPVSTEKHLAKWNDEPTRIGERFIDRIEPAGRAVCRCIAVDAPDHLYVTDDFIVTHNTAAAVGIGVNMACPRTVPVQDPVSGAWREPWAPHPTP
jgi:replicative DNA helicase